MKLGTICLASFPLRHPLLFALQLASLDVLSGGRTVLAVCSGGSASMGPQYVAELAAMGVDTSERIGRVEGGSRSCGRSGAGRSPITGASITSTRSRCCRAPAGGSRSCWP